MAKHYEWNDYYIPGTQVLRNLFTGPGKPYGETDPIKLRSIEESKVRARMLLLQSDPIKGNFDFAHMKAIHGFLFQDVYEWAGQERTAPSFWDSRMSKDGHRYFPAGDPMLKQANRLYRGLASKDYLVGLTQDDFVREYAELWNEINVVHAFREGNTRSQFVFFSQLAEYAGYELRSDAFAVGEPLRDAFVEARYVGQDTGRSDRLAEVLGQAITPLGGGQVEDVDLEALNAARLSSLSIAAAEVRYSRGGPDVSSRGGVVGPSISKDDGLSF